MRGSDTVLSSLNLLITLANQNGLADENDVENFIENVQKVSLSINGDIICFINKIFTLLFIYGKTKHGIAPSLYKILISKYQ